MKHMLLAAGLCLAPALAGAATFTIDFSVNGSQGATGTFEAPVGGGAVSNFLASISGVTFDTQVGGGAYEYDPAQGDFVNYAGFPSYANSAAVAGVCGVGNCFLEMYPLPNDPEPGDYLAIDDVLNNIDDGTKYAILPLPADGVIPLPASMPLLAAALALLAFVRRRA